MDTLKLITLRMRPWTGPELKAGHYLHHDGPRAKTAYFVITAKHPERWSFVCKCQRLRISDIPTNDGTVVHHFHWYKREMKV